MKKNLIILCLSILLTSPIFAQVAGNVNYQYRVQLPTKRLNVPYPNSDQYMVSIKGISNVKADRYVAIFSLNQAGETAEEVNELIDKRIAPIKHYCDTAKDLSIYIDMISFVPIYELDLVKKIFNKKTYNEVPKGFEIKKNIHIKYKNPNDLNDILKICSQNEIYDLVRVDYFCDNIEAKKLELMKKAKELLNKKIANKSEILEVNFSDYKKQMADGFTVVYPIEMYTQYQAVSSSKIIVDNNISVNKAPQTITHYYKPYFDKDYDFTINPVIFEPVIQILYEIKVKYTPKPKEEKEPVPQPKKTEVKIKKEIITKKEVIIVSPNGEMKTVKLN
jgi:hypothetical protein